MKSSGEQLLPNPMTLRWRLRVLHPGRIFSIRISPTDPTGKANTLRSTSVWTEKSPGYRTKAVRPSGGAKVSRRSTTANGRTGPKSSKSRRAMQEYLLSRALPQPSASEVVWNPARNWMILGTASSKMMDAFLEYFEQPVPTLSRCTLSCCSGPLTCFP